MPDLQLTPIGTSPAWYNPGEPTTGFLLEHQGFRMLVDCGSGVISRYLEHYGSAVPIDAIVITHSHADHVLDLIPLKYGIDYGPLGNWRPQLWLPPGVNQRLRTLTSSWDAPDDFFTASYDVLGYAPSQPFEVGPFTIDSLQVPHFIEAFALRVGSDAGTFGYTSDLGPSLDIAPFMAGVDLLLTEATLGRDHAELPNNRGHLTAAEAGAIAHAAGVHSLLLTHVPVALEREQVLADAHISYDGPIALAQSLQPYPIAQRLAHAL